VLRKIKKELCWKPYSELPGGQLAEVIQYDKKLGFPLAKATGLDCGQPNVEYASAEVGKDPIIENHIQ
jgi:hypothetical protein